MVALFLDVFAVVVLVSLLVAAVRRAFFAPPHLHLSVDANLILALIGMLMLSSLFGGAFRLVAEGAPVERLGPVRQPARRRSSRACRPSGRDGLARAMWWVHTCRRAVLPGLPALLEAPAPAGLAVQRLLRQRCARRATWTSPAGPRSRRRARRSGTSSPGSSCSAASPARSAAAATAPARPRPRASRSSPSRSSRSSRSTRWQTGLAKPGNGDGAPALIGGVITEAEIWACTTCMSCMERCAVLNEQIPIIVQLRRHLVERGRGREDRSRTCWPT